MTNTSNQNPNLSTSNHQLVPSLSLVAISYRLALKAYEPIAILALIPALINGLGSFYFLKGFVGAHFYFNHDVVVGSWVIALGLLIKLINISPLTYLQVETTKNRTIPTILECYKLNAQKYIKIILVSLVSGIIMALAILALLVPFIFVFPALSLAPFFAAENPGLSVNKIIAMSFKHCKPYFGYIWGTLLISILIMLLSSAIFQSLPFGFVPATIVSYISFFMPVLRYREIVSLKAVEPGVFQA